MRKLASQRLSLLSDEKIKQIMAGYKANYNRQINCARTSSEKKALMLAMNRFMSSRMAELVHHNEKFSKR